VQLEDKLVEGRDAAHEEALQREDVEEHGEDRLPEPVAEALHDAAVEQRGKLLGAIRMILDRQRVEVSEFRMPQRESRALDALQVAVEGRSSDLHQFVYASDRRDLLERALGVLQPSLTRADEQTARELHVQFADLSERVAHLRHELTELEDAQDELLEGHQKEALEAAATPGDKPKPAPSDPDAPRQETTLTGPELPPEPPAKTTLTGPELPPEPPVASTLTGPELPEEPPPPSTLGDDVPDDDAARAKRPWWRGPFG
jgi:hypothetical protein